MRTIILKILCWIPILGLAAGDKLEKEGKFYSSNSFMFKAIGKYQALCVSIFLCICFYLLAKK